MHYFHHSLIKLLKKPVVSNGSDCFHRNMAVHFNFGEWGYYILQTHTHFIFNICGIFSLNGVIHEFALTRICIVSYINTTHQNWSLKHSSICFYNIVDIYCGEEVEAILRAAILSLSTLYGITVLSLIMPAFYQWVSLFQGHHWLRRNMDLYERLVTYPCVRNRGLLLYAMNPENAWWRHQVRGIHHSLLDSLTNVSDAELWYSLWSAPEPTVEQTLETPVIRDAIALAMTSR